MKEKIARRFLLRNARNIIAGDKSPSFLRRVERCRQVIRDCAYKNIPAEERLFRMLNY